MIQLSWSLAFALAGLLLGGCATVTKPAGPDPVAVAKTEEDSRGSYYANDQEGPRRLARDKFISERLSQNDRAFKEFSASLTIDKNKLDAATEGAQLALSLGVNMVGSLRAKDNLANVIALITGGKATIDKNFYGDRAVGAIVQTMDARRNELFVRIATGARLRTDLYSYDQAKKDLDDHEIAGTLGGAFLQIGADAATRENTAQAERKELIRVPDVPHDLGVATVRDKAALTAALNPNTANFTDAQGRAALTQLGVASAQLPKTRPALLRALQSKVRASRTDEGVAKTKAAFQQAGLIK